MKITPNQSTYGLPKTSQKDLSKKDVPKHNEQSTEKQQDKYIPSEKEPSVVYKKPSYKADVQTIERLKAESDKAHEQLRNLVRQLLQRQGLSFEDVVQGDKPFFMDEEARSEAQAAIGEGGPLSPENVSDRIVEFAKAISGGDKSKFELLKNAIEEGFGEAAKTLGGKLPEISQKTYDLVMEKLENWGTEGKE